MERKLNDYFAAGVTAVWLVYPKTRAVAVYSSATEFVMLSGDEALDGGTLLPGFSVPISQIFAELDATEGEAGS
jgi:Uma2 family endonuclease